MDLSELAVNSRWNQMVPDNGVEWRNFKKCFLDRLKNGKCDCEQKLGRVSKRPLLCESTPNIEGQKRLKLEGLT